MKTITRVLTVLIFAGWVGGVSAVPITGADIVTVDGTDWAQVDLFTNLSWGDISAVCPAGVCTAGGTLNGYDVTDFIWASLDETSHLFNGYLIDDGLSGNDLLGPGPDSINVDTNSFAQNFLSEFRETSSTLAAFGAAGWTATTIGSEAYQAAMTANQPSMSTLNLAYTNVPRVLHWSNGGVGAWLYRSEEVSAPATLALFGLGLAGLGWMRRKKV